MSRRVTELPTETENVAWPQARWEVMKSVVLGTAREPLNPDSHTLTPHSFPDRLSIFDLESHFPQGWRLSRHCVTGQS